MVKHGAGEWGLGPFFCTRVPLKRAALPLRYVGIAYAPGLCEEREEDLRPSGTLGVLGAPVESTRLQTFEVVLSHRHVYV